jgi:L-rhamnose mutarotase
MAVGLQASPRPVNELQAAYYDLDRQRKVLDKLPLNSTKFKEARKVFDSIQARINTLEQQERQKSSAKIAQDRKKLQDALTRAKQYGTADQVTEAQNALNSFIGIDPNQVFQEPRFGPGGENIIPGTPEYETASTARPTVTPPPPPPPAPKPGAQGSTPSAGSVSDTKDSKQLWVSYLRTVFNTLEDKTQKAEIDRIFNTAIAQKWNEATFMEALKGTQWWQTTSPSLIQFFLESNDPRNAGTFASTVSNKIDSVATKLERLGVAPRVVDPLTGKVIDNSEYFKGIAVQAIQNNWTDAQLDNYLSTKTDLIFTGGGVIGSSINQINQTAYLYGISLDKTMQKTINTSLLDPMDGRDAQYWINSVKQMAIDAPQNKPFLESLKVGKSLYEVTSNYRNQMASLLEVDPTAITWNDLMSKVIVKDTGNARTFADFNKALKQDPLWQYTKNAKETYSNMALDLARTFGYAGS